MADDDKEKLLREADRILSENMPSPSQEGFNALHEMFLTLRNSGFAQYEALWVIAYIISNGSDKPMNEGE